MPNGWDERQGQEEASLIGLDMKGEGIPCCVAADNVRLGSEWFCGQNIACCNLMPLSKREFQLKENGPHADSL